MKKYVVNQSSAGRKVFTDDFLAIQDSANAILNLFSGCPYNFIISGCLISTNGLNYSIGSGYAYINGDICYFGGATGSMPAAITNFCLRKVETVISDTYKDGSTGEIYKVYTASLSLNETNSSVVNSVPQSNAVTTYAGEGIKYNWHDIRTAFLNTYCLTHGTQVYDQKTYIQDDVVFDQVNVKGVEFKELEDKSLLISHCSSAGNNKVGIHFTCNGEVIVYSDVDAGEVADTMLKVDGVEASSVSTETLFVKKISPLDGSNSNIVISRLSCSDLSASNISATKIISGTAYINKIEQIGTPAVVINNIGTKDIQHMGTDPVHVDKMHIDEFTCNYSKKHYDFVFGEGTDKETKIHFQYIGNNIIQVYGKVGKVFSDASMGVTGSYPNTAFFKSANEGTMFLAFDNFLREHPFLVPSGEDSMEKYPVFTIQGYNVNGIVELRHRSGEQLPTTGVISDWALYIHEGYYSSEFESYKPNITLLVNGTYEV